MASPSLARLAAPRPAGAPAAPPSTPGRTCVHRPTSPATVVRVDPPGRGCGGGPAPTRQLAHRRRPSAAVKAGGDGDDVTTALAPNRDRYHVIELNGCELLVASTPDGRLDAGDAYVRDGASGLYARPGGGEPGSGEAGCALGTAWGGPRPAIVVPWETTYFGDALFKKAGWTRTERVFLIPTRAQGGGGGGGTAAADGSPSSSRPPLDFDAVACFDAATRVLELAPVKREAPADADPAGLSLRIRSEGLILVETDALPTPNDLVGGGRSGGQEGMQ